MSAEWPRCSAWPLQVTRISLPPASSITPPTSSPQPAASVSPSAFSWDRGNINLPAHYWSYNWFADCFLCLDLPMAPACLIWHLFSPSTAPPLLLCWDPLKWCIQSVLNTKTTPQNYEVSPILKVVNLSLRPAYRTGLDPRRWNPNGMFPHSL